MVDFEPPSIEEPTRDDPEVSAGFQPATAEVHESQIVSAPETHDGRLSTRINEASDVLDVSVGVQRENNVQAIDSLRPPSSTTTSVVDSISEESGSENGPFDPLQHLRTALNRADILPHGDENLEILLDSEPEWKTLRKYLESPVSYELTATDLLRLFLWHLQLDRDSREWRAFGEWIQVQVSLGKIPDTELGLVLVNLPPRGLLLQKAWNIPLSIWQGFQSSSVSDIKSLQPVMFALILQATSETETSEERHSSENSVDEEHLPESSTSEISTYGAENSSQSSTLGEGPWLEESDTGALEPLQVVQTIPPSKSFLAGSNLRLEDPLDPRQTQMCSQMVALLETLPVNIAAHCAFQASRWLIQKHREYFGNAAQQQSMRLDSWFSELSKSKVLAAARQMPRWTEIDPFVKYFGLRISNSCFPQFNHKDVRLFILKHIAVKSSADNLNERFEEKRSSLPWERTLPKRLDWESPLSSYVDMVRVLSQYPPRFQWVIPQIFSFLRNLGMSGEILQIVRSISYYYISIDPKCIIDEIKEHVKINPLIAMRIFGADRRICLEDCPELAEAVISDPNSEVSPGTLFFFYKTRIPTEVQYAQRIDLLHRMAFAYARARHIRTALCLRLVHRCYRYIRWESDDELDSRMSRAITATTITRELLAQQSVSDEKVEWILSVVKTIEGEEIARDLGGLIHLWRKEVMQAIGKKAQRERASRMCGKFLRDTYTYY